MAKLLIFAFFVTIAVYPTLSENGKLEIIPDSKELLMKLGGSQELSCFVSSTDGIEVKWSAPSMDGVSAISSRSRETSTSYHNMSIAGFSLKNVGDYKCVSSFKGQTINETVIRLIAVTENKTEPVFEKDSSSAALSCSISYDLTKNITNVKWIKVEYKDNVSSEVLLSGLPDDQSRFIAVDANNSLIIQNPKYEDVGLYIAAFSIQDMREVYRCEVGFLAHPSVVAFDKPKNLIEGEKMDLQCVVKGYPFPDVTWSKKGLNDSEITSRYAVSWTVDKHKLVHLKYPDVEFSDAGDYICKAYTERFNETSAETLTVRVKDKLAALWPFLGIVGEVVVLCTIIFIYEKRRNKQVQLAEKAAEEMDGSATDKKKGLRHRNTNNPSA